MNSDSLRISMLQLDTVWENPAANEFLVKTIASQLTGKTDIIVLPEMFTTGFTMNVSAAENAALLVDKIKQWSVEFESAFAGSFIAAENGLYYNRAFFATPKGEVFFYDKRHLFRMAGEERVFTAGEERIVFSYLNWNICLQVCYDLRFPVWSRNRKNEYDLLIYVANWPIPRIEAWKTLLQARAIENMCFVCGVNRIGQSPAASFCGSSMIISPKGEIMTDMKQESFSKSASTIEKSVLERLRKKFPVWQDADSFNLL